MQTQIILRIAVLVVLGGLVGSVTAAQANAPFIQANQANEDNPSVYLPVVFNAPDPPCTYFFDDFSEPSSGWFVGEDNKLLAEYLDGEYRVLVKRTYSSYIIDAPACKQKDYIVQVAARWADALSTGISYGLMLGKMENPSRLYLFEVNAVEQKFSVTHYGQGGWEYIVDSQSSAAILAGAATNNLMVTHDGNLFTANVNGTALYTWEDTTQPGDKGVGLVVLSRLDQGNADARFDNFSVTKILK